MLRPLWATLKVGKARNTLLCVCVVGLCVNHLSEGVCSCVSEYVHLWTVCLRVCVKNELSVTALDFYVLDTWHRPVPKLKPENTHTHSQMQTLYWQFTNKHGFLRTHNNQLTFFFLNWVVTNKHGHACRHVTTWQTCTADETWKSTKHGADRFMPNSSTHTRKQHGKQPHRECSLQLWGDWLTRAGLSSTDKMPSVVHTAKALF